MSLVSLAGCAAFWSRRHCPLEVSSPLAAEGAGADSAPHFAAPVWLDYPSHLFFFFNVGFFFIFLSLQSNQLAAGLAGTDPGRLPGLGLSTSAGLLKREGHGFGTSLRPLCPSPCAEAGRGVTELRGCLCPTPVPGPRHSHQAARCARARSLSHP